MKDTNGDEVTHLTDEYLDHRYDYMWFKEGDKQPYEKGTHSLRELLGDGLVPIAVHSEECVCHSCKVQ